MPELSIAISAFGLVACIGLLAYVLARLPRDGRTDGLSILIGGFALVHLQELLHKVVSDPGILLSTGVVLHVAHTLANAGGLLFALHYTGHSALARSRVVTGLVWTGVIGAAVVQTPAISGMRYVLTDGVWVAHYDPVVRNGVILLNVVVATITLGLLIGDLRSRDPARRAQTRLLFSGGVATLSVGMVTDVVLPLLGFVEHPRLMGVGFLAFLGSTVYAVQRYELLRFSMEAAGRIALDRITDAVLVLDRERHLLYTNPTAAENIGDALLAQLPTDPWIRALAGTTSTGIRLEEEERIYDLALVPLETEGNRVVVAIFHDNTEIERARAAAEAANMAKSQFLANMSHELRTPLNAVIGYAEMLAEELPDQAEDLERIEASGRYLLSLINDVLDLSKVTSGKLVTRSEPADLHAIVQEALMEARPYAAKHGAPLEVEVPPMVPVHADPMRTKQILLNLLSNAAKFSQGNPITLRVHRGETVRAEVIDRGIGMDERQQARLFAAFEQVHREGHERYGGTGLGLALSRELARAMGGDILVQSEPDAGSTFTLLLPRDASATSGAPPAPGS